MIFKLTCRLFERHTKMLPVCFAESDTIYFGEKVFLLPKGARVVAKGRRQFQIAAVSLLSVVGCRSICNYFQDALTAVFHKRRSETCRWGLNCVAAELIFMFRQTPVCITMEKDIKKVNCLAMEIFSDDI